MVTWGFAQFSDVTAPGVWQLTRIVHVGVG